MSEHNIAYPAELAVLTTALDDYCARHGLSGEERESVAVKVMALFRQGLIKPGAIANELEEVLGRTGPPKH